MKSGEENWLFSEHLNFNQSHYSNDTSNILLFEIADGFNFLFIHIVRCFREITLKSCNDKFSDSQLLLLVLLTTFSCYTFCLTIIFTTFNSDKTSDLYTKANRFLVHLVTGCLARTHSFDLNIHIIENKVFRSLVFICFRFSRSRSNSFPNQHFILFSAYTRCKWI